MHQQRLLGAAADLIEPQRFDRCPVLLAHPGDDRWTPLSASLPSSDRTAGPKDRVVLERCGHIPLEDPGRSQLDVAGRGVIAPLG